MSNVQTNPPGDSISLVGSVHRGIVIADISPIVISTAGRNLNRNRQVKDFSSLTLLEMTNG
jgi:hypothetical protein